MALYLIVKGSASQYSSLVIGLRQPNDDLEEGL